MTSVLMPFSDGGDPWRREAFDRVVRWYEDQFPDWHLCLGLLAENGWSKGRALRMAYEKAAGGPLVLADADSYLLQPETLRDAVEAVSIGVPWVVPHRMVYRLRERETRRVYDENVPPRIGAVCRPEYVGPPGGGLTVLSVEAWETVRGVDDRFEGWGGEDICFGYALETLVGPHVRLDGDLIHLWHPHPAPDLRGSPESEALVARYKAARFVPRLMRALVDRVEPAAPVRLDPPARFYSDRPEYAYKLGGQVIWFHGHRCETDDPDVADALRLMPTVREET